jgi:hypothetical protein
MVTLLKLTLLEKAALDGGFNQQLPGRRAGSPSPAPTARSTSGSRSCTTSASRSRSRKPTWTRRSPASAFPSTRSCHQGPRALAPCRRSRPCTTWSSARSSSRARCRPRSSTSSSARPGTCPPPPRSSAWGCSAWARTSFAKGCSTIGEDGAPSSASPSRRSCARATSSRGRTAKAPANGSTCTTGCCSPLTSTLPSTAGS